jgi:hypothetical protein
MIALDSFEAVQNAFVMAKKDLSEILSGMYGLLKGDQDWITHILAAFEFWDHDSVGVVKSQMMQDANYPIDGKHAFYALLETQGRKQEHDQEVWCFILLKRWYSPFQHLETG